MTSQTRGVSRGPRYSSHAAHWWTTGRWHRRAASMKSGLWSTVSAPTKSIGCPLGLVKHRAGKGGTIFSTTHSCSPMNVGQAMKQMQQTHTRLRLRSFRPVDLLTVGRGYWHRYSRKMPLTSAWDHSTLVLCDWLASVCQCAAQNSSTSLAGRFQRVTRVFCVFCVCVRWDDQDIVKQVRQCMREHIRHGNRHDGAFIHRRNLRAQIDFEVTCKVSASTSSGDNQQGDNSQMLKGIAITSPVVAVVLTEDSAQSTEQRLTLSIHKTCPLMNPNTRTPEIVLRAHPVQGADIGGGIEADLPCSDSHAAAVIARWSLCDFETTTAIHRRQLLNISFADIVERLSKTVEVGKAVAVCLQLVPSPDSEGSLVADVDGDTWNQYRQVLEALNRVQISVCRSQKSTISD